jgi:hypothetical protein
VAPKTIAWVHYRLLTGAPERGWHPNDSMGALKTSDLVHRREGCTQSDGVGALESSYLVRLRWGCTQSNGMGAL